MKKEFICIVCPRGCHITVDGDNITGYTCLRGLNYVKQEMVDPKRVVTSTIKVNYGKLKVVPVKTNGSISKDLLFKAMDEINRFSVEAPVHIGQILIKNILDTGVDVVASKEIERI